MTKIIRDTIIRPKTVSPITNGCINGIDILGCMFGKLYPVKVVRLK